MNSFTLNDGLYINITPRGAYYAVQNNSKDVTRNLLLNLLHQDETPELSSENLANLFQMENEDTLDLLHRMQKLGLISGQKEVEHAPDATLEILLPEILGSLSETKKVLLAEQGGLYLGASGFPHEAAEELAAVSASLSDLYQRHKDLLQGNLRFSQHAWGLIDAAGNSEVGFWPLHIGDNCFTLVIHGIPRLNRPSFKRLVWALVKRFG